MERGHKNRSCDVDPHMTFRVGKEYRCPFKVYNKSFFFRTFYHASILWWGVGRESKDIFGSCF